MVDLLQVANVQTNLVQAANNGQLCDTLKQYDGARVCEGRCCSVGGPAAAERCM